MRRLALVFAVIAMISAAIRMATPERLAAAAVNISKSQQRVRRTIERACLMLTKRLRPLLPQAN
jgi:hypothetical protein